MSDTDFPNPVSLLNRFAQQDGSAEEILICTFNQSLPFFERHLLGPCRATGARVTVLGDIDMAEHDLVAVNRANRRYYAGNVAARGSFHPKLIAVASASEAFVAVGSGNLTIAGWLGNDELWTIHHAHGTDTSPVVPAAGDWCRRLGDTVTISELARKALERMADRLERFTSTKNESVSLLDSLDKPIIDQLPYGPVDELNLYAPFHDGRSEATRQLIARFQPAVVRVAYQPHLTSVNGQELAAALPDNAELIELASNPYRHGKLIEWRKADQWWAVTGSPNLSTAALCRTTRDGGNVELAVLSPSPAPLLPEGSIARLDAIAELSMSRADRGRREKPILLAATLDQDRVIVEFVRPLEQPATLQVAEPEVRPDTWPHTYPINSGAVGIVLPPYPGGSRLRIKLDDKTFSNAIFVADPVEILATPSRSRSASTPEAPTIIEIFNDPPAGRRFLELLEAIPRYRPSPTSPSSTDQTDPADQPPVRDWREYLAFAEEALSAHTIARARGQSVGDSKPRTLPPTGYPNWDGTEPKDKAGGLDGDDPDDPPGDEPLPPSISGYQIRRQTRTACWRNLVQWPTPNALGGLTRLYLMIRFVAAGGFDFSDDSWVPDIFGAIRALDEVSSTDADAFGELNADIASLTAVVLAATDSTLSPVVTTGHHAQQRVTEKRVRHLLGAVDIQCITEHAKELNSRFGYAVEAENVKSYAERVVLADPLSDAIEDIQRAGFDPTQNGHSLEIVESAGSPIGPALAAISRCSAVETVSVMCRTGNSWALAAWQRPHLLVLQPGANGQSRGNVYDLTGVGLGTLHTGELSKVSDHETEWFSPLQPPSPLASAVLSATGWHRNAQPVTNA